MKNFQIFLLVTFVFLFTGCETINKKSDEAVKKENEALSKFIGQPETELRIVMGNPTAESKDNKGARVLIYKNKKYGITCERKFELSDNNMIVGFSSKGCF